MPVAAAAVVALTTIVTDAFAQPAGARPGTRANYDIELEYAGVLSLDPCTVPLNANGYDRMVGTVTGAETSGGGGHRVHRDLEPDDRYRYLRPHGTDGRQEGGL